MDQPAKVSVLIIGAGINGVGLFRELALQQIDVLLIDRADFCSGASATSTRIIHGGIRYLENGEFRLVREALLERKRLLENAPHYVKPLPTTIPVFDWFSGIWPAALNFAGLRAKPNDRGALLIKAGLSLYDRFAGADAHVPPHRFHGKRESFELRPALNPSAISTATYYDAKISYPERLCVELVLDAEAAYPGARARTYTSIAEARPDALVLLDQVTGERWTVQPSIVVNATGAWIDLTNHQLRRESAYIGGTKGSHLVLNHPELHQACCGEMIYFSNRDGRTCIFYPVEDRVIAGSTDIPTDDPDARCDENEVDYILESVRFVFPAIQVDRSHIVYRFCGVRPLPRSNALTPGQISRDHSFPALPGESGGYPVYSLVGGKWTTFRAFSEQVCDELLRQLGRKRIAGSVDLPIGGGRAFPMTAQQRQHWCEEVAQRNRLSPERVDELLERYGTRAESIAAYMAAGPDAPLTHCSLYTRREIEFLIERERVVHLDDVILRRTMLAILGRVTPALVEELAGIAANLLNWNAERGNAEKRRAEPFLAETPSI